MATIAEAPAALRQRLEAAGIVAPRVEAVVIDLAGDPPLGRSQHRLAVDESEGVVAGLGVAMAAARARRGVVAVRERAAARAIEGALRQLGAGAAKVVRLPPRWPSLGVDRDVGCEGAWILDGEGALDLAAAGLQGRRPGRRVTVVGAVQRPGVLIGPGSVGEAIAAAGGSREPTVVALGGPLGGALLDEDSPAPALILVLAPHHPLVLRARLGVADWLRRAASACESCRQCSDACPVALDGGALEPHGIIATLRSGRDDGTRLAAASACTACGVCDVVCPSGLSPRTLVGRVTSGLPPSVAALRGPAHRDRGSRRLSIALILDRLGLAELALPTE